MSNEIRVAPQKGQATIKLTHDLSAYYANIAKEWATKSESPVSDSLYSAKYYAEKASEALSGAFKQASETELGIAKIATSVDVASGEDDTKIITPAKLSGALSNYALQNAVTTAIAGKADTDFSNISDAAKQVIQENSASGGGSWGSITGTLSAQTDLQTALNNCMKKDLSNSSKPYIVETSDYYSDLWYRIWSNGWIEQCAIFSMASNADKTVSLIKSLDNTTRDYMLLLTPIYDSATAGSIWIKSKEDASFVCHNTGPAGSAVFWAGGYAPEE